MEAVHLLSAAFCCIAFLYRQSHRLYQSQVMLPLFVSIHHALLLFQALLSAYSCTDIFLEPDLCANSLFPDNAYSKTS